LPYRPAPWRDLSDRGSTACFAANSFLATCAAVHESRRGCNSDGRRTTDLPPDGSSMTDADGSNGHRLLERRNWSDCPLERTPPRRRRDQPLMAKPGVVLRRPVGSTGPSLNTRSCRRIYPSRRSRADRQSRKENGPLQRSTAKLHERLPWHSRESRSDAI
jgi:hypothetical protein